ncbi:hypothetical protein D8Y22_12155 [Salinadaptatus halalkaliphilus]|uniref:DUF4870 domain-containing protein n=1 Tax=Salinadaptatus halalkaliphilus TaxID=2419781 RepID=A0A4S3TKC9_9EURY|nr:hypothetical protein [Salinadaptatus halalkaliphilus]THE64574.1 hypothetical protein D8Y22_12155 [Salinadaptatus halalkaliphilus]
MATEQNVSAVEPAATTDTSLGPDGNVVALLAHVFTPISGILVYLLEEDNEFARYHAAHSVVFGIGVIAVYATLQALSLVFNTLAGSVPVIGFLLALFVTIIEIFVSLAIWLVVFVAWLYLLITAYQGEATRLPVVSSLAEKHLL